MADRKHSPTRSEDSFEFVEDDDYSFPGTPKEMADPVKAPESMSTPATIADTPEPVSAPGVNRHASTATLPPAYTTVAGMTERSPVPQSPVVSHATGVYDSPADEKARLRESYAASDAGPHPATVPEVARDEDIPVYSANPEQPALGEVPTNVAALNRGLQVPSNTQLLSSGFPYPATELAPYRVSAEDWARFTHEITSAAKLEPKEWAVAIGTGAGTALVAGLFIGWLGLIPAIMVSRAAHRNQERQKVSDALYGPNGNLERALLRWNEEYFAPRGILIRLDLPGQSGNIEDMDVYKNLWLNRWARDQKHGRHGHCRKHEEAGHSYYAPQSGCSRHSDRHAERSARWAEHAERWTEHSERWAERAERRAERWAAKAERHAERFERKVEKRERRFVKRAVKRGRVVILPIRADSTLPENLPGPPSPMFPVDTTTSRAEEGDMEKMTEKVKTMQV